MKPFYPRRNFPMLHYKSMGQGPALIVLHGLFGSLDNWVTLGRQWAESYSVYLVDQRNHGRSFHSDSWTYEAMAEDLHDLMVQESIYQAHLLGHSMGGKTVMHFAGLYPERIERLMVADMGIRHYRPHHTEILEALISVDLSQVTSRQEVDALLAPRIPEAGVRQFLTKALYRNGNRFAWRFNLPVIYDKYEQVLAGLDLSHPFHGPTLFLTGGKSNYVRPADRPSITELFPQAKFSVIPKRVIGYMQRPLLIFRSGSWIFWKPNSGIEFA